MPGTHRNLGAHAAFHPTTTEAAQGQGEAKQHPMEVQCASVPVLLGDEEAELVGLLDGVLDDVADGLAVGVEVLVPERTGSMRMPPPLNPPSGSRGEPLDSELHLRSEIT